MRSGRVNRTTRRGLVGSLTHPVEKPFLFASRKQWAGQDCPGFAGALHFRLRRSPTGIAPPSNVLRHSFGTYSFHDDEDESATSFKMGSAAKTVKEWYVAMLVDDEDGQRWRSITPDPVQKFLTGKFAIEKWQENA